jgi:protein arginine N-methyltransferase 1
MRRTIRPGAVVADLGCGTGYFSLVACQLGARKVYAIEPAAGIELARECARASGLLDRIEFIRNYSTRIDLPEKLDVIVSDLRGTMPLHAVSLASIIDARRRFLAPDGVLICQRDTLQVALIDWPAANERVTRVWDSLPEVDQSACKAVVANTREGLRFDTDVRVGPSQPWAVIDYTQCTEPHVSGVARFAMQEPFRAHGLGLWFDAELAGGLRFTSGPDHPGMPVYNRVFLPWPREVLLAPGHTVSVQIEARSFDGDYAWSWETRMVDVNGHEIAHFSQSSLLDSPLAVSRMKRRSPAFRPELDDDGVATRLALTLMDGAHAHREIAEALRREYPRRFATLSEALDFVTSLSMRFARTT